MNLASGLYKYVMVEKPIGTFDFRTTRSLDGSGIKWEKDHYQMIKDDEYLVGAGFLKVIQHRYLIDGLSANLRTYPVGVDLRFIDVPVSEHAGLRAVASHLASVAHMKNVRVSHGGNLVSAYEFIAGGFR